MTQIQRDSVQFFIEDMHKELEWARKNVAAGYGGEAMKDRVRNLTKRTGGRSIEQVAATLRSFLVGWKEYFRLAETPGVFGDLDNLSVALLKVQSFDMLPPGSSKSIGAGE